MIVLLFTTAGMSLHDASGTAIAASGSRLLSGACPDLDHDGYADCSVPDCDPMGQTCGDCNDDDPAVHAGAPETCNNRDEDCNGRTDDGFERLWGGSALMDPGAGERENTGFTLAPLGDLSGDGIPDFAVSSPDDENHSDNGSHVGSVGIVSGSDRSSICRLFNSGTSQIPTFGRGVAAIGDLTGDGVTDIAAGESSGGLDIFSGADCSHVRKCTVIEEGVDPRTGEPWTRALPLGYSVAAIGDVTGDAIPDIITTVAFVSAPGLVLDGRLLVLSGADCAVVKSSYTSFLHPKALSAGDLTADGLPEIARYGYGPYETTSVIPFDSIGGPPPGFILADPENNQTNGFGAALALMPDETGEGVSEMIVGAPLDDNDRGIDAGTVYVFSMPDGQLRRQCTDPVGASSDRLGGAVGIMDDITGDGSPEILAGAAGAASGGRTGAGQVVIFSGADCSVLARLSDATGSSGASLGAAVISPGDLTGDGVPEVVAGAPDQPPASQGRALVFSLQSDCDGDGITSFAGDCDDVDPGRHPGRTEDCDGVDDDCDGLLDEDAAGQVDPDSDGVAAACDNCPAAGNADQDDLDADGHGDACDNCPTIPNVSQDPCVCAACIPIDITISFRSEFGRGSGVVSWRTGIEHNLRGFNVLVLDNRGNGIRLNDALIPCTECVTDRGAIYSFVTPKHKSGRNVYIEQVRIDGAVTVHGPATRD